MRAFWDCAGNVGDGLTPYIIEHFIGEWPERALSLEEGKVLVCGSTLEHVRQDDIAVGIGSLNPDYTCDVDATYLAVRGPLTASQIPGTEITTFGDPGLLLPIMYYPSVEKQYDVGVIPHYEDKEILYPDSKPGLVGDEYFIDIEWDWKSVVRNILKCRRIISSSLHGIVLAEAYGVPTQWAVYSDRIAGGEYKFQDYFLGTGRQRQQPLTDLPPIPDLSKIQNGLIEALEKL